MIMTATVSKSIELEYTAFGKQINGVGKGNFSESIKPRMKPNNKYNKYTVRALQKRLRSLNMRCTGNKAQLMTRLFHAEKEREAGSRQLPEIQQANNVQVDGFAGEKINIDFVGTREVEEQKQTIHHEDLEHNRYRANSEGARSKCAASARYTS